MLTRRELLKWTVGTGVALGAGLSGGRARADLQPSLAVVVAKESPLRELSLYELKRLYLGTPVTDPSGQRIIPFNQMPRAPDRVTFESRVLGMSPEEVARYWIDRKIRGQGSAPKAVGPADLLQRVVSRLSHAIGYVRVDQVLLGDVRVIAIDGKSPGDSAYKLFA